MGAEVEVIGVALLPSVEAFADRHGLLRPGERVLAAVSGGPDSVALLHVLLRLARRRSFEVHGAHVDHGLREDSRDDAEFVRRLCAEWGVEVTVVRVDTGAARRGGESVQQAARRLRLGALRRIARQQGAVRIALGHHLDDQAETVLLRLLRGAGTTGLAGMRPVRGLFIRPLLAVRRADVEAYVAEHGLRVVHDVTNLSDLYVRNRIRLGLMPLLEDHYNPNVVESLARTAAVLQADDELLRALADDVYESVRIRSDTGAARAGDEGHGTRVTGVRADSDAPRVGAAGVRADTDEPRVGAAGARVGTAGPGPATAGPRPDGAREPEIRRFDRILLSIPKLASEPEALRRRVLRRAFKDAGADLRLVTYDHTEAAMELLHDEAGGALTLPGNLRVERTGAVLVVGGPHRFRDFSGVDFFGRGAVALSEAFSEQLLTVPGRTVIGSEVALVARFVSAMEAPREIDSTQSAVVPDSASEPETPLEIDSTSFPAASPDSVSEREIPLKTDSTEPRVLAEVRLDADSLRMPIFIRPRQPGDRMRPVGLGGTKKVQDLFVDERVPRAVRDRVPLLLDQGGIVWIPGLRIDERAATTAHTRNILHLRLESL